MRSSDVFRLNVRSLMDRQGLKVKDLADMVGLSSSYLSLILSGERGNLSDLHKDAIALALGTTVSELYLAPGDEFAPKKCGVNLKQLEQSHFAYEERDISAFDDFLSVLNIRDDAFLAALYRELNTLSDDEVARFSRVLRRAMAIWGERKASPNQAEHPSSGLSGDATLRPRPLSGLLAGEEDLRKMLAVIVSLSKVLDQVPLSYLRVSSTWDAVRMHSAIERLEARGFVETTGSVEGDKGVCVRPSPSCPKHAGSLWLTPGERCGVFLALAENLEISSMSRDGTPNLPKPDRGKLAQLYLEGRDYSKARVHFLGAAEEAQSKSAWRAAKDYIATVLSLDSILNTPQEERAVATQMMVAASLHLGDLEDALVYQERNIRYWERTGNCSDLVRGYSMLGSIRAGRQEYREAEMALEQAIRFGEDDLVAQCRVLISLAGLYYDKGEVSRAKDEFERALDISGRVQEPGMMAQALLGLGRVSVARGDLVKAQTVFNRALALSERREPFIEMAVRLEVAKMLLVSGKHKTALSQLAQVRALSRRLRCEDVNRMADIIEVSCMVKEGVSPESLLVAAEGSHRYFAGINNVDGTVRALLCRAAVEAAMGNAVRSRSFYQTAVRVARDRGNPYLESLACSEYAEFLKDFDGDLSSVMEERANFARGRIR